MRLPSHSILHDRDPFLKMFNATILIVHVYELSSIVLPRVMKFATSNAESSKLSLVTDKFGFSECSKIGQYVSIDIAFSISVKKDGTHAIKHFNAYPI